MEGENLPEVLSASKSRRTLGNGLSLTSLQVSQFVISDEVKSC
jgi:hypothetical protein